MKVLLIERRAFTSTSIERVFAQVAKGLRAEGIEVVIQRLPFRSTPLGVLGNLLFFRPVAADVFHLTGDGGYMMLRLPASKTVITFHDLIALKTRSGLRRWVLKKLFLEIPAKRARWITAVSNATSDDIHEHHKALRSKIRVIANPLLDGFTDAKTPLRSSARPVILQVGTALNKNVPRVIEAIDDVDCHLRIVGPLTPEISEALERYKTDFSNIESAEDDEIIQEYANADLVTLCSTSEGFGLPIIEAQAVGRPVVTSNIAPMTEVAGAGAILVDPNDPVSIRRGIENGLNDESLRTRIISAGAENVKRFDPAKICRQYLDLYEEVVAAQNGS